MGDAAGINTEEHRTSYAVHVPKLYFLVKKPPTGYQLFETDIQFNKLKVHNLLTLLSLIRHCHRPVACQKAQTLCQMAYAVLNEPH